MKDYEVCTYCIGINNSDYCPCKDIEDTRNTFSCDFYVTDFKKVTTEIRADAIDEFVRACECINMGGFNVYSPYIKQIGKQLKEKADE